MSRYGSTFMDQCLKRECALDAIDDFVDQWHEGDSALPLSEFLGLTSAEYAKWVEQLNSVELIFLARIWGLSTESIVTRIDRVPNH